MQTARVLQVGVLKQSSVGLPKVSLRLCTAATRKAGKSKNSPRLPDTHTHTDTHTRIHTDTDTDRQMHTHRSPSKFELAAELDSTVRQLCEGGREVASSHQSW